MHITDTVKRILENAKKEVFAEKAINPVHLLIACLLEKSTFPNDKIE